MIRTFLAAAAAFALLGSSPAFACPDCKDCPKHQEKAAAAEKADRKGDARKCACDAVSAKDCKCGGKCDCHATKKDEKKGATNT